MIFPVSHRNSRKRWVDYWGCKGYVGPPLKFLGDLPPLPLPTMPGRVAQSVGYLTRKSGVLGLIPGLATYFRFSFRFFKKAVVSYWRKYVHEVLVNRLGGLSLPRKSAVRLTDRPDMSLDVYRGRKTTIQQPSSYAYDTCTWIKGFSDLILMLLKTSSRKSRFIVF